MLESGFTFAEVVAATQGWCIFLPMGMRPSLTAFALLLGGCEFPYSVATAEGGGDDALTDAADGSLPDAISDARSDARSDATSGDAGTEDASTVDGAATGDAGAPKDATAPCPEDGGTAWRGHCYFPTAGATTWSNTSAACASAGAHLATVASAEEQAVVTGAAKRAAADLWIGLSRKGGTPVAKSSFRWVTGEPVVFEAWAPADPNVAAAAGACVRVKSDGLWWDLDCTTPFGGVCEREP